MYGRFERCRALCSEVITALTVTDQQRAERYGTKGIFLLIEATKDSLDEVRVALAKGAE